MDQSSFSFDGFTNCYPVHPGKKAIVCIQRCGNRKRGEGMWTIQVPSHLASADVFPLYDLVLLDVHLLHLLRHMHGMSSWWNSSILENTLHQYKEESKLTWRKRLSTCPRPECSMHYCIRCTVNRLAGPRRSRVGFIAIIRRRYTIMTIGVDRIGAFLRCASMTALIHVHGCLDTCRRSSGTRR